MMRVYILGICGTFMGGLALIARQLGYEVRGNDQNVYPPMSDTLQDAGIEVEEGYDSKYIQAFSPDVVIIGNSISRGNAAIEYILNKNLNYTSGPQWLAEQVLLKRHVLAVSGTHGKTTTTSILTWILSLAGRTPGYLIGGVPQNFSTTADLGKDPFFVIEGDEYDSAFFDKRSKFIHYRPRTLIFNNLEYDHADIFPDLEAIKKQFQFLLRVVPANGTVIYPSDDANVEDVIARGCWATKQTFSGKNSLWHAKNINQDGSQFELWHRDQKLGTVSWDLLGHHNIKNALAAAAAAHDVGITSHHLLQGLNSFRGVKRRLEVRGQVNGIWVYDDFAHHPTAISTTVSGLRARVGNQARIIAVLQFGSNTMRLGLYKEQLVAAFKEADTVELLKPDWDAEFLVNQLAFKCRIHDDVQSIIQALSTQLTENDHVLIMSNKSFDGIHQRLLKQLHEKANEVKSC